MKHSRICPCGYRVPGGTLCGCQQRRRAARPSASARGYGADWQALRASTPHTPCADCSRPWKAGYHLDHIKARNAGGTDDASNLAWRCHRCHSLRRPSTMVALATPVRPRKLFTKGRLTGWVHTSLKGQIEDFQPVSIFFNSAWTSSNKCFAAKSSTLKVSKRLATNCKHRYMLGALAASFAWVNA